MLNNAPSALSGQARAVKADVKIEFDLLNLYARFDPSSFLASEAFLSIKRSEKK